MNKLPKIIALCGYKGSGKDTVAEYLVDKYKYNHYIDWLEQLCYDLNSTVCRNTILDYERKNNKVRKKKYKKMKTINNKWSN